MIVLLAVGSDYKLEKRHLLGVASGYIAMVIGNGMMIEAGDPVQLSPIRATNLGQGFQGFWRRTA
jgi:peptidoglycan DL-endopeptidase CwlO